ncbi:MAG: DUF952 domain-containing protein [Leptolyngbyaceae cyanobacterium bins.349]|nr:DUF952 domain-containing protein [Leptolyngbyaceae cyanobacterium bins.349]
MIFHITNRADWQQAQTLGAYQADSLATEGFIHCSQAEQVTWVANQFYRGLPDLVLLCIDPAKLTAELQYDQIETGDRFPHLYGALNLDAVVEVLAFPPQADGTFQWPQQAITSRDNE